MIFSCFFFLFKSFFVHLCCEWINHPESNPFSSISIARLPSFQKRKYPTLHTNDQQITIISPPISCIRSRISVSSQPPLSSRPPINSLTTIFQTSPHPSGQLFHQSPSPFPGQLLHKMCESWKCEAKKQEYYFILPKAGVLIGISFLCFVRKVSGQVSHPAKLRIQTEGCLGDRQFKGKLETPILGKQYGSTPIFVISLLLKCGNNVETQSWLQLALHFLTLVLSSIASQTILLPLSKEPL